MNPVGMATCVAAFLVGTGVGMDKVRRQRRLRRSEHELAQQNASLDAQVEQEEQRRHESEIRSGEFDLQG